MNIQELHKQYTGNFVDYTEFEEIASTAPKKFLPGYVEARDYGSVYELRKHLKEGLETRIDKNEVQGLSALQVGLPIRAVYLQYDIDDKTRDIILTDPEVSLLPEVETPEYFIKLIKCPTSLTPYHLGLFSKDIYVTSSNSDEFKITDEQLKVDPQLDFSAKLQQTIWATKGYVPGDKSEILLNYAKTSRYLADIEHEEFKDRFKCTIHRDEIFNIIEKLKFIWYEGSAIDTTSTLFDNLLYLLTLYPDREWIPIPALNLIDEPIATGEGKWDMSLT